MFHEMNNFYKKSMTKVLAYIDSHLDDDLSLEKLSKLSGLSSYHFHRLFKSFLGLSLGEYVKLKRLESGMWKLIYTDKNILEIALDSGYENHSAFTRAFTKEMGIAPKEFKKNFEKNQKLILNKLHKNPPIFKDFGQRKETTIFYMRKFGSYFISAKEAWSALLEDLRSKGLMPEKQVFYGISQDNPNDPDTKKDKLRFDVCVELSHELEKIKHQLEAKRASLPSGNYAVFLHKGPVERLSDSYFSIYGKWIFENNVTLRHLRPFIKYIDPFTKEIHANKTTCEIYLPIE